jgi:hypothetical protein
MIALCEVLKGHIGRRANVRFGSKAVGSTWLASADQSGLRNRTAEIQPSIIAMATQAKP